VITEAILNFFGNLVASFLGLLPTFTVPGWLQAGGALQTAATTIGTYTGGLNRWLPIEEVLLLAGIGMALSLLVLGFKLAQFVWSLVTGGGGAT
jgi:hypothetical protein